MKTFFISPGPTSNLRLERWVVTRVAGWGGADVADWDCLLTVSSVFVLFCRSLTETMSWLDWGEGRWKPYGKDLETALQSKKARSCSAWGFLLRRLSGRLSSLFHRLNLYDNQLTSLPDCLGQLTNLTKYDIRFDIWFQFSSLSLIGFISTRTSWARYRTVSATWRTWPCTTFILSFDFNSYRSLLVSLSAATSWLQYRTVLASSRTWPGTTLNLKLNFNSHSFLS